MINFNGRTDKHYQLDNTVNGSWLNNRHVRAMVNYFRDMPEENVRHLAYDDESDRRYHIFNAKYALDWELWFQEE